MELTKTKVRHINSEKAKSAKEALAHLPIILKNNRRYMSRRALNQVKHALKGGHGEPVPSDDDALLVSLSRAAAEIGVCAVTFRRWIDAQGAASTWVTSRWEQTANTRGKMDDEKKPASAGASDRPECDADHFESDRRIFHSANRLESQDISGEIDTFVHVGKWTRKVFDRMVRQWLR